MRNNPANRRASILSFWLPSLMDLFFRGSHTTNFVTCGFNRSYNQAAEVPSSNVTCKSPRSPSINCRIMLAFVSMTHSITIFPASFLTAIETLSLCTSMPIYLVLVMRVFLSGEVEFSTQNLLQKGHPFILRRGICDWVPGPTCPVRRLTRSWLSRTRACLPPKRKQGTTQTCESQKECGNGLCQAVDEHRRSGPVIPNVPKERSE